MTNKYYDTLHSQAPANLKETVATLRTDWKSINVSGIDPLSGKVSKVERPRGGGAGRMPPDKVLTRHVWLLA